MLSVGYPIFSLLVFMAGMFYRHEPIGGDALIASGLFAIAVIAVCLPRIPVN